MQWLVKMQPVVCVCVCGGGGGAMSFEAIGDDKRSTTDDEAKKGYVTTFIAFSMISYGRCQHLAIFSEQMKA